VPAALRYEVEGGDVVVADVVEQRLAREPAGELDAIEVHRLLHQQWRL
jgi:hypothetical protein